VATIDLPERLSPPHLSRAARADHDDAAHVRPTRWLRRKRVADCVLAGLLLIPALPLIGLLVLLVRLTSRGPGVYRQTRVGQFGRIFTMYKIRSMVCDAEQSTGAVWARAVDPRVTRVGRMLRRLHLDELPQLFNVLAGEMSLVGPRPERPEFVQMLANRIPGYVDRLSVAPGITGLAQVNLPPDTDLDSVRRKLYLDLEYVRHGGLWLDLRLLVGTALRVGKVYEPLLLWLLGLKREVPVQVCAAAPADEELPPAAVGLAEGVPAAVTQALGWSVASNLDSLAKTR
jgi:lipopolysaccharide/colanic/teichoic acid biosynthesis glycosyltransferase